MSRVGKKHITIDPKAEVKFENNVIHIKGPKGELTLDVDPVISVEIADGSIAFTNTKTKEKAYKAKHGLYRALVNNMLIGVTQGFQKNLELNGVGYRVQLQGNKLQFSLGYSHPIVIEPPKGIEFKVEGQNKLFITGIEKQVVGEVAAKIRKLRPPEPYKGKGVKYDTEVIRRKAGKSVKK